MKSKLALSVVVVAALGFGALGPTIANAAPPVSVASSLQNAEVSTSQVSNADEGRALFRASFFLQGDLADDVLTAAQFDGLSQEEKTEFREIADSPEATEAIDKIVQEIDSADGAFFADFANDLRSGRPSAVKAALDRATAAIGSAPTYANAIAEAEITETYIPGENGDIAPMCGLAVVVAAGLAIVVAAIAVVNAFAGVNVALGYNVAAGQNVAYAANYTSTRSQFSADPGQQFDDAGYVASLTAIFTR